MPDPATNLHIVNQLGGQVVLAWDLPATIQQADAMFLDIATENGFVAYVVQDSLVPRPPAINHTYNLPPGSYWARVNMHYPGFGLPEFGPLDRGWFPSAHIPISVEPVPPLPTGTPASHLVWNPSTKQLSWTPGTGSAPITHMSVDLSTFPNFSDILASPFISTPAPACEGTLVGYPFAFNMGVACTFLKINGQLAPDFYARVNTLYGNRVWIPSEVFHIVNGIVVSPGSKFPWIIVVGAAGILLLGWLSSEKEQE